MSMLNWSMRLSTPLWLRFIGWRIGNAILVIFLLAGAVSALWLIVLVLQAMGITAE